jgi:hypothetical protein
MKKTIPALLLLLSLQIQAQFFENFDGNAFPPQGWAAFNNGFGAQWESSVTTPYQGINATPCAYVTRLNALLGNTSEEWLVTPAIPIGDNKEISFYSRQTLSGNNGSTYLLKVSTTSQTNRDSFVDLAVWNEDELADFVHYLEFTAKSASLSDYAGQTVYIAFVKRYFQETLPTLGDRWLVENVSVDTMLQRDNFAANSFSIYPNPAMNVLHIQTKNGEPILSATVYNPLGQMVLTNGNSEIDISRLAPGNYFITVDSDKRKSTLKFIKQ